jgi:hypothetical protein
VHLWLSTYLPYTLRKLCLPDGAEQHHADPGWLRTESICSHPSILSFTFKVQHPEIEVWHSRRSDYRGVRRVVLKVSNCYLAHCVLWLGIQAKPGHRAQTCRDRRAQLTLSIIPGCRIFIGNLTYVRYPSPSHLSVHAHRSPISSHCRADTIQIRKSDTQHVGAWGLTPRCLLRQLV